MAHGGVQLKGYIFVQMVSHMQMFNGLLNI